MQPRSLVLGLVISLLVGRKQLDRSRDRGRNRRSRGAVPQLWSLIAIEGCLLVLLACADEQQHSLFLAGHLEVAEVDGHAESLDSDLRIHAGAVVTYYFPLPEAARLVGTSMSDGSTVSRVEVQHESGVRRLVFEGEGSLDVDLSAHGGEMVCLRFAATGPDAGYVQWQALRIDGALHESARGQTVRGRYNVLLLLFDSLRADQTAPYGARDVRTRAVQGLADAGVTFVRARSSASWTRSAVAAMFTSLAPPSHGVLSYEDKLPASVPYLPELLRDSGYYTVAVVNNAMVSRSFGFARGFDENVELFAMGDAPKREAGPGRQAAKVWSRFIGPALERAGSEPFFVYLHELDPHSPYDPPEPFRTLYDFGYQGGVESTIEGLRVARERPEEVSPEDVRHLRSQYRGEISYMDRYLAGILGELADAGLAETTVVVLVSDHGEEFWDHRSVGHGHSVYEEQLRVPFLMRLEGVLPAGRQVEADVGLIDLAPTLLDLLDVEMPERMQGVSLLSYLEAPLGAGGDAPKRGHFGYAAVPPSESVSFGRWKLIRHAGSQPPRLALFDLARDPGEKSDVGDAQPVVVGALAQMLRAQRIVTSPSQPTGAGELPEAVLENLRALGYAE